MNSFATAIFFVEIGRSFREAFFMFWKTLWALVLGFGLSGFVQAFISKSTMQKRLGSRSPLAVLRASGYGMVSSSCSYAASALSKSLFKKGADFVTSMVFMVASTNLIVELGLVLLVLMGWQFTMAEFVGGPIMIVLLALFGGLVFTAGAVKIAWLRLNRADSTMTSSSKMSEEHEEELVKTSFRETVRSPGAWSDGASYAVADATML